MISDCFYALLDSTSMNPRSLMRLANSVSFFCSGASLLIFVRGRSPEAFAICRRTLPLEFGELDELELPFGSSRLGKASFTDRLLDSFVESFSWGASASSTCTVTLNFC
jgi:hypothetical protein